MARNAAAACLVVAALLAGHGHAAAGTGYEGVLPAGSDLGETALDEPREIFKTDIAGGTRSYLLRLGDMAFSAPSLLGTAARQAGISCNTCHQSGAGNASLFIPGLSSRPGTFDTSSSLFNAKADNHVSDPVRIPSLRGVRFLAPYGHDGRFSSLRDFVRNVIVGEFAGAEPSPEILDAIIAYLHDIEFLPNPRLGPGGRLTAAASSLEKRGEALFRRPFPHDAGLSCAGCHVPSAGFTDHRTHDVGSGGLERTPTLRNADFNAPYFHDGRYASYEEVVGHFDRVFDLGLGEADRRALVAYLEAVGDGEAPTEPRGVDDELVEMEYFVSVLDTAIPAHDRPVIAMTVETVIGELRELIEQFPEHNYPGLAHGKAERRQARGALKALVLDLRRLGIAAETDDFAGAAVGLARYRTAAEAARPLLEDAEPYSLFNPDLQRSYLAALRLIQPTQQ